MSRRTSLSILALVAVGVAAVAFLMTGSESRDGPVLLNGDFETGDFSGWSTQSWGDGEWGVYDDGATPPNPSITDDKWPFDMPDPPQGQYAAVTDMNNSSANFLYRDIEVTAPMTLHAIVFYENHGLKNHAPERFGSFDGDAWFENIRNQQFRIDVIDPESMIYSMEADDVLGTVFRTLAEDPFALDPTEVTMDLSPWEGQTVRLRVTQVDNIEAFRAGIDDVWLEWIG